MTSIRYKEFFRHQKTPFSIYSERNSRYEATIFFAFKNRILCCIVLLFYTALSTRTENGRRGELGDRCQSLFLKAAAHGQHATCIWPHARKVGGNIPCLLLYEFTSLICWNFKIHNFIFTCNESWSSLQNRPYSCLHDTMIVMIQ